MAPGRWIKLTGCITEAGQTARFFVSGGDVRINYVNSKITLIPCIRHPNFRVL